MSITSNKITTHQVTFSASQKAVLLALYDTFIPSLNDNDAHELATRYSKDKEHYNHIVEYAQRPGHIYVDQLITLLTDPKLASKQDLDEIMFLLSLLSTPVGTMILCGHFIRFVDLTQQQQDQAIKGLLTSIFETKRKIGNVLRSLFCLIYYSIIDGNTGQNLTWQALQYPGPDPRYNDPVSKDQRKLLWRLKSYDLRYNCIESLKSIVVSLQQTYNTNATLNNTSIIQKIIDKTYALYYDVIIIGSGSGGGVAAYQLSSAGYKVLVLEAGEYIDPDSLSLLEFDSLNKLYMGGGVLSTDDKAINLLAGQTFGGGSAVNWSCCLSPPADLRTEWAEDYGLSFLQTPAFSQCVNHVMNVMQVNEDNVVHNESNKAIIAGCKTLGYPVKTCPQNSAPQHQCGYCCFGCPTGGKQGTNYSFLPRAMSHGAHIATNSRVTRILYNYPNKKYTNDEIKAYSERYSASLQDETSESMTTTATSKSSSSKQCIFPTVEPVPHHNNNTIRPTPGFPKRLLPRERNIYKSYHPHVTGVEVMITNPTKQTSSTYRIGAKIVISSCGSLQTPLLLQRSYIQHPEIGKHLRLHIAGGVGAVMPYNVQTYHGSPMTTVCEVAKYQEKNYGSIVEVPSVHTGLLAFALPWYGGKDFKEKMLQFNNIIPIISINRDKTSEGTVSLTSDGTNMSVPSVSYTFTDDDKERFLNGIIAGIYILVSAGAKEIVPPFFGIPSFAPDPVLGVSDPKFIDWITLIRMHGISKHSLPLFSAHQMGSARMHKNPQQGPTRVTGELYTIDNLYICDASTFPTASGVNPMITIMSMAQYISFNVQRRLEHLRAADPSSSTTSTASNDENKTTQTLSPMLQAKL